MMGAVVDNKATPDIMHDQMKSELQVVKLSAAVMPILIAKSLSSASKSFNPSENIKNEKESKEIAVKADQIMHDTSERTVDEKSGDEQNTDVTESASWADLNVMVENSDSEVMSLVKSCSDETTENASNDKEVSDVESITCVEYLKPIQNCNDTQSSDLSDTDTTDKQDLVYIESGVDETSRDERDEASEIENFDLSSCGEDSLEAMYYMIRKNEIIMDRQKQTNGGCEDDKVTFPEKATDDLEHAVREVSGKKLSLCMLASINSSDEVILKKLSSDSDELQLHVIPNSEIDSSSDQKSYPLKEQCTTNESTDDEYINPILESIRKENSEPKAFSVLPNQDEWPSDDQQLETDTFDEHIVDDMIPGNIERKILASSVSEADSDYFECPATSKRLTKDDFNVSTAFEHMVQTDSMTESSESTFESAVTKIQAGARGFLARRRIRKFSAGTSASNEKRSSIGNAAIDKSLDNLIEQQELAEETGHTDSFDYSSAQKRAMMNDQTMDSIDSDNILGITEVKVEHRLPDADSSVSVDEKLPEINIQGISEESATAQRRLTLQRGDAMQSNSTPESSEQQNIDKGKPINATNDAKNVTKDDDKPKIDSPPANGEFITIFIREETNKWLFTCTIRFSCESD